MKIVSLSPTFGNVVAEPAQILREQGWAVELLPRGTRLNNRQAVEASAGAEAVVAAVHPMREEYFDKCPRLKVVAMHGAGVDHIDLAAAKRAGVVVCNVPGGNALGVAELGMGLILNLARSVVRASAEVAGGGWPTVIGSQIAGQTLGIVGYGTIGRELGRMAGAMGMEVVAFNRSGIPGQSGPGGVRFDTLESLLARSDFVSLHMPLTDRTKGLIGAGQLALMKDGAYLVNLARGGVLDEKALLAELESGRLAGAALDVFSVEPPVGNPLVSLPQVIATPHIGGYTRQSLAKVGMICAKNILAVLKGEKPLTPVN